MKRDINKFRKELADYINRFIAGSENTYIEECALPDLITNRGQAIYIKVVMPKEYDGDLRGIGPCFYAEELMAEYPDSTVAFIAEVINKNVTENYKETMFMITAQMDNKNKTIDDYRPESLVISAIPAHLQQDKVKEHFCTKDMPDTGLSLTLKAVNEIPENDRQIYLTPVNLCDGRMPTDEEWERADDNTLAATDVEVNILPLPLPMPGEDNGYLSIAGHIADRREFYDWFYLASPKKVWMPVMKETKAEKIYIVPVSPALALFVVDNETIRKNPVTYAMIGRFMSTAAPRKHPELPVFVIDADTCEIKEYRREDSDEDK